MNQWRIKQGTDAERVKRHVEYVLLTLDGNEFEQLSLLEARLVTADFIECRESRSGKAEGR